MSDADNVAECVKLIEDVEKPAQQANATVTLTAKNLPFSSVVLAMATSHLVQRALHEPLVLAAQVLAIAPPSSPSLATQSFAASELVT
jgi:hypothetical protein